MDCIYFSNSTIGFGLVIGQRPNFTVVNCSAWADCENCSFDHCLMQYLKPLLDSEIPDVSRISLGMKKFSCIDYKLGELVKVV